MQKLILKKINFFVVVNQVKGSIENFENELKGNITIPPIIKSCKLR